MKILIFDTETTGISSKNEYVLQFGAIIINVNDSKYNIIEEYNKYIQIPNKECISEEAFKIHKITYEMCNKIENPTEIELCHYFLQKIAECDIIIGFNIAFDLERIMYQLFKRHENIFGKNTIQNLIQNKEKICLMKLAKNLFPIKYKTINNLEYHKSPKLQELYFILFAKEFDAHDAFEDVKATLKCYAYLYNISVAN